MNNASQMQTFQVYAVIAGIRYEGEVFNTLKLFDCKSAAQDYYNHLHDYYDYVLMETKEVYMQSAISS